MFRDLSCSCFMYFIYLFKLLLFYFLISYIFSKQRNTVMSNINRDLTNDNDLNSTGTNSHSRLSWPQFHRSRFNNSSGGTQLLSNTNKINNDDKNTKQMSANNRRDLINQPKVGLERVLCPDEARVMYRANQIVMYVPIIFQPLFYGDWVFSFFGVVWLLIIYTI